MLVDKYLALKYVLDGNSWDGVNCFGLFQLYYKTELDIDIPLFHKKHFATLFKPVKQSNAKEHDIVIMFNGSNTQGHIGIYIGNEQVLHASELAKKVIISNPKELNVVCFARYVGDE